MVLFGEELFTDNYRDIPSINYPSTVFLNERSIDLFVYLFIMES